MSFPRYPAYKPSGVEWLGEVPEHWEVLPLKRRARLLTEKTDNRSNPVALENIESWTGRLIETETEFQGEGLSFEAGDILFGKLRPYLAKVYLASTAGEAVGDFHVIHSSPSLLSRLLQYQLLNREVIDLVNSSTYGAKMPRASWSFLGSIGIPIPPFHEQPLIATFLDRETAMIDALIAEQQRLIELLQEKHQAVISHAVTKGLNPDAPMKDSGVEWLGEVPEHWEVLPCRAILNERDERNNNYRSDYYLSLVAGRGVIPYDEKGDIGNKKPEDLGKCKHVREGDFVINSMNYGIGSYGVSRYDGVCSPVYIVVTPIETRTRPGFAFRVLENKWFQQYAQSFGNGILAHRCAIGWDVLKNIKAGLPPENEQLYILRYLDEQTSRFEDLIAEAEKQVNLLKERRSALISAAVTGQIDVRGLVAEVNAD
jgi:type I restriction enzyme S subunit